MADANRVTRDDFDAAWYLATYGDVRAAGLDPWEHYGTHGHDEGRLGAPVRAFEREALAELRLLMRSGSARERAVARALVWRQGGHRAVPFRIAGRGGRASSAPVAFGVQTLAHCGDLQDARRVLIDAQTRFGMCADITLAELAPTSNEISCGPVTRQTVFKSCPRNQYYSD